MILNVLSLLVLLPQNIVIFFFARIKKRRAAKDWFERNWDKPTVLSAVSCLSGCWVSLNCCLKQSLYLVVTLNQCSAHPTTYLLLINVLYTTLSTCNPIDLSWWEPLVVKFIRPLVHVHGELLSGLHGSFASLVHYTMPRRAHLLCLNLKSKTLKTSF